MSRYKVIQDIEAEDKLLGPLTLRQFIFAIVAAMFYYFIYLLISKHAGIFAVVFLPVALFATFFAIPFGGDQPTEIWALAKIRFMFKPRRRIWDQSGVKELVTVTAPKKVEEIRTDGLSQHEIKSRLSALANTIDSRGWAVKNVNLNMNTQGAVGIISSDLASDRLVDVGGFPQDVPTTDIQASDDILDEQSNPIAQQFDQMIAASTQAHRQQIMAMMQREDPPVAVPAPVAATTPATWFTQPPINTLAPVVQASRPTNPVQPFAGIPQAAEPTAEEEALALRLKAEHDAVSPAYGHLKTLQPIGSTPQPQPQVAPSQPTQPVSVQPQFSQPSPANEAAIAEAEVAVQAAIDGATQAPQPVAQTAAPVTPPTPNPAILELAHNNDLNVATIARQAQQTKPELPDDGEVVIALR